MGIEGPTIIPEEVSETEDTNNPVSVDSIPQAIDDLSSAKSPDAPIVDAQTEKIIKIFQGMYKHADVIKKND